MTEIKKANAPAAVTKANTNAVADSKQKKTMKDYIEVMKPEFEKALPEGFSAEKFTRMAITAVNKNPALAQCTMSSFFSALMNAAQAGLEPNSPLGEAYLIPYRNKGQMEVQYVVGYQGRLKWAHRDHVIVTARVVYENDEFSFQYGMNEELIHKPALTNRGKPIAFYATWKSKDYGSESFTVMSKEDVDEHAKKFSKAYSSGSSPWVTNYESMALKTVVIQALKYAPKSMETRRFESNDETIKNTISSDMSEVDSEINYSDFIDAEITDAETGEVKHE